MQIVIPMAGKGSRFAEAGYELPKPFIDVDGVPMIVQVMHNLALPGVKFVLVAQRSHQKYFDGVSRVLRKEIEFDVAYIDGVTEGTACTVLLARKLLDTNEPVVIANSDQLVDGGIHELVSDAEARGLDGSIMCFKDDAADPKWSFAKVNARGLVTEVKEKEAISNLATVGIYYFSTGQMLIDGALDMMLAQDRVNGEYYTCPIYNYLIAQGLSIGVSLIPEGCMHGIGTPEDLNLYLNQING